MKRNISKYNLFTIFIFLLIIYIIITSLCIYFTKFDKIITISDKFIKPGNKRSHFKIVDKNDKTYTITDNILLWEFNSGDDYAQIKIGNTYKIYGYWFRYPIFSWYPMIYKFESIESFTK
jgi:hypothetical protein